ncbi:MAG: SAM-dependent methyltransferase [bacterium]|nr:SAM-dependent methyltransferase [bacterium]
MSPEIYAYLLAHGSPIDDIQRGLIDATNSLGGISIMQIAPEQGAFMTMLTQLMGARRAIEIGTFTGYSALCLARGLPDDGRLVCCDISDEWPAVGKPFWEKAGVAGKIDLRIAPAIDTLRALPGDEPFDLAFIDADKEGYAAYYEELLRVMRPGGVILVDNVLLFGLAADEKTDNPMALAIRSFNDLVAKDPRVDCVMLAISDGLTFLRVR